MEEGSQASMFTKEEWREIERILGYAFTNRQLAKDAFQYFQRNQSETHLERLAFMGDRILGVVAATEAFKCLQQFTVGGLHKCCSNSAKNTRLAVIAVTTELYKFLKVRKEEQSRIEAYVKRVLNNQDPSKDRPKILADMVEAVLAAVFIDSKESLKIVREVLSRITKGNILQL